MEFDIQRRKYIQAYYKTFNNHKIFNQNLNSKEFSSILENEKNSTKVSKKCLEKEISEESNKNPNNINFKSKTEGFLAENSENKPKEKNRNFDKKYFCDKKSKNNQKSTDLFLKKNEKKQASNEKIFESTEKKRFLDFNDFNEKTQKKPFDLYRQALTPDIAKSLNFDIIPENTIYKNKITGIDYCYSEYKIIKDAYGIPSKDD